jgi:hypothetical protein
MPNARQRNKNKQTAANLARQLNSIRLAKHICENCGKPGGHWISTRPTSLQGIIDGVDDQEGFWTCAKVDVPDMLDAHLASRID